MFVNVFTALFTEFNNRTSPGFLQGKLCKLKKNKKSHGYPWFSIYDLTVAWLTFPIDEQKYPSDQKVRSL